MKTSTKLLIVLFISIPLSLIAYNHLLNKQYEEGKLVQKIAENKSQRIKTDLPPFKHVVINGAIVRSDTSSGKNDKGNYKTTTNMTWYPNIYIESNESNQPVHVDVLKPYKDLVAFRVQTDTLYISFHVANPKGSSNYSSYGESIVRVHGSQLESMLFTNANFRITGKHYADSVRITAAGIFSNYKISKAHLKYLSFSISDSSKAIIESNSKIEELSYSILDKAHLTIESPSQSILRLTPGKIDSATVITLSGSANEMKKFMTPSGN